MMVIAWVLGRVYEDNINAPGYPAKRRAELDWVKFWSYIVERGLYEVLRKCVVSDLKSQVWQRILDDDDARLELKNRTVEAVSDAAGEDLSELVDRMNQCADPPETTSTEQRLAWDVLRAASRIATSWEFELLEPSNAFQADTERIRDNLERESREFQYVPGVRELERPDSGLRDFVNLCGRLRFQERWSTTPIMPRCPVLDHELMVANLTYLVGLSRKLSRGQILANFFAALFHDLVEAMTRDIVRDVKVIGALNDRAQEFGLKEFRRTLKGMLPPTWYEQVEYFAAHGLDGESTPARPPAAADDGRSGSWPEWNLDIVAGADDFANFVEAVSSVEYGVAPPDVRRAVERMMLDRKAKRLPEFKQSYEILHKRVIEGPWGKALEQAKKDVEQEP
jgi:putative hydrolase of HD superfamily